MTQKKYCFAHRVFGDCSLCAAKGNPDWRTFHREKKDDDPFLHELEAEDDKKIPIKNEGQ